MFLPLSADQLKHGAKRPPKARAIVSHNREAAAPFGAIECECGNDGVPSDPSLASDARHKQRGQAPR